VLCTERVCSNVTITRAVIGPVKGVERLNSVDSLSGHRHCVTQVVIVDSVLYYDAVGAEYIEGVT
jgi:hypothetical protein